MLRQLCIENYALIDRLDVEFHGGLNLLTGETGSGKSIVVDAMGLLLGDKGALDMIRSGAPRARIVGVFTANRADPQTPRRPAERRRMDDLQEGAAESSARWRKIQTLLEDKGIDVAAGDELILQRDLMPLGRSRVFINNQPATVGLLKALAPLLAEVHGQNEQQALFDTRAQLEALDRFGDLSDSLEIVRERFEQWKELGRKLDLLKDENQEWIRQRDFWEFQKREIEQAGIVEGEEEGLEEEKRFLSHAERIQTRLAATYDLLYDSPNSAVAAIGSARRHLEEVSSFDGELQPLLDTLNEAKSSVEDLALVLRDRLAKLESSPGRLEEVENRLAQLDSLKRKYSMPLKDILGHWKQLCGRLDPLEGGDAAIHELERKWKDAARNYETAATALSSKRSKVAKKLILAVEQELAELAMSGTKCDVQKNSAAEDSEWRPTGIDTVEFLISPNPGEPLLPLTRIASGGETSRIMLALETAIACRPRQQGRSQFPDHALIFDEIDAGIGGRAAESVGQKLRKLGENRQVLCVSHLPQIASFAHHHFRVEKTVSDGRTVTQIAYIQGEARRTELARMLSGSQISPAVLAHAGELLKTNAS